MWLILDDQDGLPTYTQQRRFTEFHGAAPMTFEGGSLPASGVCAEVFQGSPRVPETKRRPVSAECCALGPFPQARTERRRFFARFPPDRHDPFVDLADVRRLACLRLAGNQSIIPSTRSAFF